MERVENGVRTPQAWTRTQGKGRVFYTAFGSEQTMALPAFRQLVEQGVLYAVPETAKQAWDGAEDAATCSTRTGTTSRTTRTAIRRRSISCRSPPRSR